MCNVLKPERQKQVLHMLLEGNSIRSTERVTGVHRDTICRLLVRFGQACKAFMDSQLRNLTLDHVEVDEIWTFVAKKQARLTPQRGPSGTTLATCTCGPAWTRKPNWSPPIWSASGRPTTPAG